MTFSLSIVDLIRFEVASRRALAELFRASVLELVMFMPGDDLLVDNRITRYGGYLTFYLL